jgi:hypothetical protein
LFVRKGTLYLSAIEVESLQITGKQTRKLCGSAISKSHKLDKVCESIYVLLFIDFLYYTVIVKDQNGDVVVGAAVQMCDADTCKMPTATNEEGKAIFNYDPSNYYVTVQEAPEGYTCDPEQKFYFEGDATELTVVITKN